MGRCHGQGRRVPPRRVTHRIRFHPLATAEVVEVQLWYETRVNGLGDRFLGALRTATNTAVERPKVGTPTRTDDGGEVLERKVSTPASRTSLCTEPPTATSRSLRSTTNAAVPTTGLTARPNSSIRSSAANLAGRRPQQAAVGRFRTVRPRNTANRNTHACA